MGGRGLDVAGSRFMVSASMVLPGESSRLPDQTLHEMRQNRTLRLDLARSLILTDSAIGSGTRTNFPLPNVADAATFSWSCLWSSARLS